jgi:hypothetical protein
MAPGVDMTNLHHGTVFGPMHVYMFTRSVRQTTDGQTPTAAAHTPDADDSENATSK